jgi:hypothetical protein
MLYASTRPRSGPADKAVLKRFKLGMSTRWPEKSRHVFVWTPTCRSVTGNFAPCPKMLLSPRYGPDGFEGFQGPLQLRLYLNGRSESIFSNLTQGRRRKVRIALKRGVEIRAAGSESLDDFVRLHARHGTSASALHPPKSLKRAVSSALGPREGFLWGIARELPSARLRPLSARQMQYVYGASDILHATPFPTI